MKIQINNKSKINNPVEFVPNTDPAFINSFEGLFNENIFKDPFVLYEGINYESYLKYQANNLDALKSSLDNIGLQMEYIWLIIFRNDEDRVSTSFVIKTNTNNEGLTIFWRKYMSRAAGSGQNDLFLVRNHENVQEGCVDKIKVKFTDFINNPNIFLTSL
jgi:hypothetical protein